MDAYYKEIKFTDADVVNPNDYIPAGKFNPHNVHPILIHDHGFTVAVVFASDVQDALDIAVDNDKLDAFLIDKADYADYGVDSDNPICAFLGNASEPFDIEALDAIDLPNPKFSFTTLFMYHMI
jgi:hypothetical protein